MLPLAPYPDNSRERTRWILAHRGAKNVLDPSVPYAFLWEEEFGAGELVSTATLFLTNKECPYRCLMCDLWQNTLDHQVPLGAIPAQIDYALSRLPAARQIKLYNAGSWFDPQAIPPKDYAVIAKRVQNFERVIVECHPNLIDERVLPFRDQLNGHFEIAMGLETAHAPTLAKLNKRITRDTFAQKAAFLRHNGISLRVFILLRPPFQSEAEGLEEACRSLDFAFAYGAEVCCVIPTRAGNGTVEALAQTGDYAPPTLQSLETAVRYGLSLGRGRVFADLWDIEKFFTDAESPQIAARLEAMNRTQTLQ
jgi:archaeosine synthase beta-subunit